MMRKLPFFFMLLLIIFSCKKSSERKDIMGSGKMERVLYDYHISRAIASQYTDSQNFRRNEYAEAVFRKHGITRAIFDSSMVWYSKHADELFEIYEKVEKRMQKESNYLGMQTSASSTYAQLSGTGDTANIWSGRNMYCLTIKDASPLMSFSVKADTSFFPGDRFLWHFNTHFLYPDGRRNAVVSLSVRYDNDSVGTITRNLTADDDYGISLSTDYRPIKQVYGFIYHISEWTPKEKLLVVSNITLVRFHSKLLPTNKPRSLEMVSDSMVRDTMSLMENTMPKVILRDRMAPVAVKRTTDGKVFRRKPHRPFNSLK